jgi:hypothetical protein
MKLRTIAGGIVVLLMIISFLLRSTLFGLASSYFPWSEDRFVGRSRAELEVELAKTGRYLTGTRPCVWYFTKGEDYSIGIGSALNVGFVTIRTNNAGVAFVEKIEHGSFVDSL